MTAEPEEKPFSTNTIKPLKAQPINTLFLHTNLNNHISASSFIGALILKTPLGCTCRVAVGSMQVRVEARIGQHASQSPYAYRPEQTVKKRVSVDGHMDHQLTSPHACQ